MVLQSQNTPFPLGVMAGGPNSGDPVAEAAFEAQFNSFTQLMGTAPSFMDGYIDQSKPISEWASNASYTAYTWKQSGVATNVTPVIGLPMASNGDAGNPDAVFKAFASGQYDGVLRGIVSAWAQQGYSQLYIRPGYEMNITSSPWYAGSDPGTQADWVAAFQHIADVLHSSPDASVKVVWNPNVQSWNGNTNVTQALYPGDRYVDVVGADLYNQVYPRDFYDWAANNGTVDPNLASWAANPVNRAHYWDYPAGNENGYLNDGQGNSLSLQQLIDFAKEHGKPIGMAETGAGGNATQGPSDDPAFPQWLAGKLASAASSGVPVAFVNIWDLNAGDTDWTFSGAGANRPQEAAAWAQYFGANQSGTTTPPAATAAAATPDPTTAATPIVLNVSEDAYQGDAQFTVTVDGTQYGGVQTVAASHSAGQTDQFVLNGPSATAAHDVVVTFLNDAYGGSPGSDRNLYVDGISSSGATTGITTTSLQTAGSQDFQLPAPADLAAAATASLVPSTTAAAPSTTTAAPAVGTLSQPAIQAAATLLPLTTA